MVFSQLSWSNNEAQRSQLSQVGDVEDADLPASNWFVEEVIIFFLALPSIGDMLLLRIVIFVLHICNERKYIFDIHSPFPLN